MFQVEAVIERLPTPGGSIYRNVPVVCKRPEREPNKDGGLWFTEAEAELVCDYLRTRYGMAPEVKEYYDPDPEANLAAPVRYEEYDPFSEYDGAPPCTVFLSSEINYTLPFEAVLLCNPAYMVSEAEVSSAAVFAQDLLKSLGYDLPDKDAISGAVTSAMITHKCRVVSY